MNADLLFDVTPSIPPIGANRPTSRKQKAIIEYLTLNKEMTLAQATELVGGNVYYNQRKHTGALLSNMVARGLIQRKSPGSFALPS